MVSGFSGSGNINREIINGLLAADVLSFRKRQEFVFSEGYNILLEGIARRFNTVNEKTVTTGFFSPYEFISVGNQNSTSKVKVEFLALSKVAFIPTTLFENMCADFPALGNFSRNMSAQLLKTAERYAEILRHPAPIERFSFFVQSFPLIATRITDGHIASYLGLSRGVLNRVKNKYYYGKNI